MKFTSAMQLKDWIKNRSAKTGVPSTVLLQSYMMERFLERISLSAYKDKLILKGGFLIASMIGIENRTTKDIDTTVKGLPLDLTEIERIINEIIAVDVDDDVTFVIVGVTSIHEDSEYDDFRISLMATFHTIKVNMKIDVTVGDIVIPREIEYKYKLMFEDRSIPVMAYNLYNILAEKIETILSRNVTNSRGRDFYDVYMLLTINRDGISRDDLMHAINVKAKERNSTHNVIDYKKHLDDITKSPEIDKIWTGYMKNYPYAEGITMPDITATISSVFDA